MAFGNRDLAVDLGTANTLVYERGRGIVVSEPSVIAVDADRGEVYAVGDEAHRMIGRTPATISATRPLRHGVIADFEVTEQMLRYFLRKAQASRWSRPRVVMCVPSGVTEVETRAVEEACLSAGARQVALIEEPIAAAIGAGLEIAEPTGHMVVDIGGGTSEVAVISMGEIVVETSLRLAGYDLDEAIMAYVRRHANLAIGQPTAEEIKITAGSAFPMPETIEVEVRGRELLSGLPRTVMLDSDDIRAALAENVQQIVDAVRETLDQTPPELSSDILIHGILLAGGGALLHGLAERLESETSMPTRIADSPLTCVAVGAGQALEEFEAIARRQVLARRHPRSARPAHAPLDSRHDRPRQALRHRPGRQPRVLRAGAQAARLPRDAGAGARRGRHGRHAAGLLDRAGATPRRRAATSPSASTPSRRSHAFHAAALAAGGTDNGAPGLRPHYHQNYYGAFVLDPDGNNVEAVYHGAMQPETTG